jgi:hypothetical protein
MLENIADNAGRDKAIEELLANLPTDTTIEVELPSECRIYNLEDPGAPITLRPMNFEDEKVIVNAKKNQDPTNIILERCLSNVHVHELLSMDKLYLLMKLREISYGDDYKVNLICPACKAENPTTVKLSQLNVNPVPDDFTDPVEVMLPGLQKTAKIKRPRVKDEKLFTDGGNMLDQLWRFVVELGGHTDKAVIAKVVERLPIKDSRTILNAMKTDYGVDTHVKFGCNECGEVSVVDLPIDANFFDVN